MTVRKTICAWVRSNNGITQILLADPETREELTMLNWKLQDGETFEQGQVYYFYVQPAVKI